MKSGRTNLSRPAASFFGWPRGLFLQARVHRLAKLVERLVLDLPYALARQADSLADFFQRHRVLAFQAVAELEDGRAALVDLVEQVLEPAELIVVLHLHVRRGVVRVGDELVDRDLAVVAARLRRRAIRFYRLA